MGPIVHCCEIQGTQLIKFSKFLGHSGIRGNLRGLRGNFEELFHACTKKISAMKKLSNIVSVLATHSAKFTFIQTTQTQDARTWTKIGRNPNRLLNSKQQKWSEPYANLWKSRVSATKTKAAPFYFPKLRQHPATTTSISSYKQVHQTRNYWPKSKHEICLQKLRWQIWFWFIPKEGKATAANKNSNGNSKTKQNCCIFHQNQTSHAYYNRSCCRWKKGLLQF